MKLSIHDNVNVFFDSYINHLDGCRQEWKEKNCMKRSILFCILLTEKKTKILIFMCFLQNLFCKGGRCAEKSNSGDPMTFSKGGVLSC